MRSRTFLLAIAAALLVGAGPAQAHDGGHGHHHKSHHQRHKPRAVDVQLLSINDFHGNLASPGSCSRAGRRRRSRVGGADYLARHINAAAQAENPNTLVVSARRQHRREPARLRPLPRRADDRGLQRDGRRHQHGRQPRVRRGLGRAAAHAGRRLPSATAASDGDGFDGADFDYLSANVVDDDTGKTLFRPYEIRRVGGVKVGFIGVVLKDTPTIVTPSGVEGLTFGDEADAINKYTAKLKKKGVRAIVVLMHQGDTRRPPASSTTATTRWARWRTSSARSSKEVDLYLTGHTHAAYNCVIGGKRATSASSFGRVLTDANLRVDRRTGQVVSVSADEPDRHPETWPKDPAQTAIVDKYTALSAPIANRRIGASTARAHARAERGGRVGPRRHHRRLPARRRRRPTARATPSSRS